MLSNRFTIILIIFLLQISIFLFSKPTPAFAVCLLTEEDDCSAVDRGTSFCGSNGGSDESGLDCLGWFCNGGHCSPPGTTRITTAPTAVVTRAATTTAPTPPGGAGETCYYDLNTQGIKTALGCVPTEPSAFILAVSQLLSGIGGGIALLLMIAGSFKMITSGGNPDGVKAGSEQFTSALIGLLFIIFAVLLLKVIGVDILNIPGFIGPPS